MNRVWLSATVAILAVSLSCSERQETSRKQHDPEPSLPIQRKPAEKKQAVALTWRSAKEALVELIAAQEEAFLNAEYPQLIRLLPAIESWRPPPSRQSWEKCVLGEDGQLGADLKEKWFHFTVQGEDHIWWFRGEFRRNGQGKWTAHITREKEGTLRPRRKP